MRSSVGKRVMGVEVPGKRRRGRPKRIWLDSIRNDLQNRANWRRLLKGIGQIRRHIGVADLAGNN